MSSTDRPAVKVRFWGVRGSIACPGDAWSRYGGNTSCVEVCWGSHRVILDGGSGLRQLGRSLGDDPVDLDLLLTHTHIDHLLGLPFFAPLYAPGNRITLWAGHLQDNGGLRGALGAFMAAPLFPVPPTAFESEVKYVDFQAGESLTLKGGLSVRTARLNHPNGATGYRLEFGGKSVCYVTDTEHVIGEPDSAILELIEGSDLMIYDSTYTDAEFGEHVGWGHSTWQEGVRLCEQAGVGRLVVFHHDPAHDDDFMDAVAQEADAMRPGTVVAREGLTLTL